MFGPDEDAKVFLSSADWMPRNFFRRVEVMFPVLAPDLVARILRETLPVYLADNVRARRLDPDGAWRMLTPGAGQPPRAAAPETRIGSAAAGADADAKTPSA